MGPPRNQLAQRSCQDSWRCLDSLRLRSSLIAPLPKPDLADLGFERGLTPRVIPEELRCPGPGLRRLLRLRFRRASAFRWFTSARGDLARAVSASGDGYGKEEHLGPIIPGTHPARFMVSTTLQDISSRPSGSVKFVGLLRT